MNIVNDLILMHDEETKLVTFTVSLNQHLFQNLSTRTCDNTLNHIMLLIDSTTEYKGYYSISISPANPLHPTASSMKKLHEMTRNSQLLLSW